MTIREKCIGMLAAILIFCNGTTTSAQTIVKDKEDGSPVAYAHVLNQNSEYIGQTDAEGKLLQNLTLHKWFANKACPGEFLEGHMSEIAEKVNVLLQQ